MFSRYSFSYFDLSEGFNLQEQCGIAWNIKGIFYDTLLPYHLEEDAQNNLYLNENTTYL